MKTKWITVVFAAVLLLNMLPMASAAEFSDVNEWDWFHYYVTELAEEKIINGMTDTTYAPNGNLTYGQALKLIARGMGEAEMPALQGVHWATGYQVVALEKGWLTGDVNLDDPVTRLAFCQIAAKAAEFTVQPEKNPFTDTKDPHVLALVNMGIINGMSADKFQPAGVLTRAQIAKIIWGLRYVKSTGKNAGTAQIPAPAAPPSVTKITIPETLTMTVGTTQKFTAEVTPAVPVILTWTAGNSAVATVDQNGIVTAHSAGQCHISATAPNGVKSTCLVTVKEAGVTFVNISSALSMMPGETAKLPVVIGPASAKDKSLTWTAGNPAVATVDQNGVVTAVKPGQCHITATAKTGVKSTCLVTVEEIPLTNLTISSALSMMPGETKKLPVIWTPANATNKSLTWTAGNPAVATVDQNGKVTALKAGQCHITVSAPGGLKSTCLVTVEALADPDDFVGRWMDIVSQRASMEISYDATTGVFAIEASWSNSAFESTVWRMRGKVEGKGIRCFDRKQYSVNDDGERLLNTGTAFLYIEADELYWQDSAGEENPVTDKCVFGKMF